MAAEIGVFAAKDHKGQKEEKDDPELRTVVRDLGHDRRL
jgi:hypothetical protein